MAQFRQGYAQTNVDGHSAINYHSADRHRAGFSRDAIAEVEVVRIVFDATQGRSQGDGRQRGDRSGTNLFAGRSAPTSATTVQLEDFITHTCCRTRTSRLSATFGGPIKKDRIHFFGAYGFERDRRPTLLDLIRSSPDQESCRITRRHGAIDYQFTPQSRLKVRVSG